MKIPIFLEMCEPNFEPMWPDTKAAHFFRQCSRCSVLIGPFSVFQLYELADTTYCTTCKSILSTIKKIFK